MLQVFQYSTRNLAHGCLWSSLLTTVRRNYTVSKSPWKSVEEEAQDAGGRTRTSIYSENAVSNLNKTGGHKKKGGAYSGRTYEAPGVGTKGQISKTMIWLLRHSAKMQGLPMRPDGYVRVKDLLNHPSLRTVDFLALENIVKSDSKKRYHLLYEPHTYSIPGGSTQTDFWWIRANQGHSMPVELALKRIHSAGQIPMAVHGTSIKAWESIATQGLSKMDRNYIHLAQGVVGENVVSGMRSSSQILIYIDVQKCLAAGLKLYLSSNGVVLTEGNKLGFLEPQFFEKVQRVNIKKDPVPGFEGVLEVISNTNISADESPPLPQGIATAK